MVNTQGYVDKMSSGHDHHEGFGLNSQTLDRILQNRQVREHLFQPCKEDDSYDIPYVAGYSKDGSTIYIDRHLPEIVTLRLDGHKREINPRQFLRLHESLEKALIDVLGYGYTEAHKAATAYERRGVLQRLGPHWWDPYQSAMEVYIKADEHEKLKKVPKDLDLLPYKTPPVDHKLVNHLEKFVSPDKVSKEEADYSPTRGKPGRHCGSDHDWPHNYCSMFRKPNSCTAVTGVIATKGGCKLYQKAEE